MQSFIKVSSENAPATTQGHSVILFSFCHFLCLVGGLGLELGEGKPV
jgi:hypothetical protein